MSKIGHMQTPYVTTAQAATALRRSRRTVIRMVDRGDLMAATKLPGIRGAYLIDRESLDAYLDSLPSERSA